MATRATSCSPPAQASAGPSQAPVEVESIELASNSSQTVSRKVVRKQKHEGKEYAASDLADLLRVRKAKGQAKYWEKLAIEIVSVEEKGADETLRYDKVSVRCIMCDGKHDGKNLNVPNFASTHFKDRTGACICKHNAVQGEIPVLCVMNPTASTFCTDSNRQLRCRDSSASYSREHNLTRSGQS
jgi:hypothetical protein